MRAVFAILAASAAALSPPVQNGQGSSGEPLNLNVEEEAPPRPSHGLRQELVNYMDVQYFANISVGGQLITGMVDTGSFELVVFESHCEGCGLAGRYNSHSSPEHSAGTLFRSLFYGSGDVYANEAFDEVALGPFVAKSQSFWEAYEASMPLLMQARFQSIIGVGPPEMPSLEAWRQTYDAVRTVEDTIAKMGRPAPWQTDRVLADLNFSVEVSHEPVMLRQYNISLFSLCFLSEPGSPGYMVWNDTSFLESPLYFRRVRVVGRHTWAVPLTQVQLVPRLSTAGRVDLGCSDTCAAIVDSGTSLLMMPSDVVNILQESLKRLGATDCRAIQDLPNLDFLLDGQAFSLTPDAYLTEAEDDHIPESTASFARVRQLLPQVSSGCRLAVMESYSSTQVGPMWVLGMPFFRKYYTTFNVGRSFGDRSLHIAPATSDCYPEAPEASLRRTSDSRVSSRRLSMRDIFLPKIVKMATAGGDVEV